MLLYIYSMCFISIANDTLLIFLTLFTMSFTINFYFRSDLRNANPIKFMQYYGTITLLFVTKKLLDK